MWNFHGPLLLILNSLNFCRFWCHYNFILLVPFLKNLMGVSKEFLFNLWRGDFSDFESFDVFTCKAITLNCNVFHIVINIWIKMSEHFSSAFFILTWGETDTRTKLKLHLNRVVSGDATCCISYDHSICDHALPAAVSITAVILGKVILRILFKIIWHDVRIRVRLMVVNIFRRQLPLKTFIFWRHVTSHIGPLLFYILWSKGPQLGMHQWSTALQVLVVFLSLARNWTLFQWDITRGTLVLILIRNAMISFLLSQVAIKKLLNEQVLLIECTWWL